jgi:tRNA modification GTPase
MSTIYALSTYFAKSAIAVVRVTGRDALNSLQTISQKQNFIPNKATLTNLYNKKNEVIDKALVVYFKAPNSYTGENLVEYHLHGSPAVIKEMLEVLSTFENHSMAVRGEFTKRALENNKLSLIEAEGIADLIEAETKEQKKQAIRELQGEVGQKYQHWYDELKYILALVESTIDFSDQDIPEETFEVAYKKMDVLLKSMETEIINGAKVKKLKDGIKVAIIGEPNVGKSSLINHLSRQDVAIVSSIAGTTRDVIEVFLDIGGFPVSIADTAGIRETNEEIEKEGIRRAILKAKQADVKLIVLDGSKPIDITNFKDLIDEDSFLIINKADILDKSIKIIDNGYVVSVQNKQGLNKLEEDLVIKFRDISAITQSPIVLQQRHNEILSNSIKELNLALENKQDIVILSFYIRNALNEIGKILGKFDIEEILDIVFSKFCIGK